MLCKSPMVCTRGEGHALSPPNRKKKCHLPLISKKYLAFISIRPWGFSSNWLREGKGYQSKCETSAEVNNIIIGEFGDGRIQSLLPFILPMHTIIVASVHIVFLLLRHLSNSLILFGDQNFHKEETNSQTDSIWFSCLALLLIWRAVKGRFRS